MVAARARGMYDEAAKERQKAHADTAPGKAKNTPGKFTGSVNSDARDAAGKALGVSGKSVDFDGEKRRDEKTEAPESPLTPRSWQRISSRP